MKTKEDYAILICKINTLDNTELTDRAHAIIDNFTTEAVLKVLKQNSRTHTASDIDKITICHPNCHEIASAALQLRDHFLSQDWGDLDIHHTVTPKIFLHFGAINIHTKDPQSQKIISVTGSHLTYAVKEASLSKPWQVICSEPFQACIKEDPKNIETIYAGKQEDKSTYSVHWKNEVINISQSLTHEECKEHVESMRKSLAAEISFETRKNISELIKKTICYNQGRIAIFTREMSEHLSSINSHIGCNRNPKTKLNELTQRLHNLTLSFSQDNFTHAQEIYKLTGRRAPRICIKAPEEDKDCSPKIFTLCRSSDEKYDGALSKFEIQENTSIHHVVESRDYFFCNSLPDRLLSTDVYEHPRINQEEVAKYIEKKTLIDNWSSCWKLPTLRERNLKPYYRSIIVVPMTLAGNNLGRDFWEQIKATIEKNIDEALPSADQLKQRIVGFWQIDSQLEYFFEEEFDINIAFIFADMMALFFLAKSIYLLMSETYCNATKLLSAS